MARCWLITFVIRPRADRAVKKSRLAAVMVMLLYMGSQMCQRKDGYEGKVEAGGFAQFERE